MKPLADLEKSLGDVFKDAPVLPKGLKDFLVQIAPWAVLLGGIFSLWSAWGIYKWANTANSFVDYANELSRAYGGDVIETTRWSVSLYISLAILVVIGLIYLYAFSPLKAMKKQGWDLLFLAMIVNLVYGVVIAFTSYGGFGNLIGTLIGSVIGAYILFQIRDYYIGKQKVASKPASPAKK